MARHPEDAAFDADGAATKQVKLEPGSPARRAFIKAAGVAAAAMGAGLDTHTPILAATDSVPRAHVARGASPATPPAGYNILFILTDQERHFDQWPFPVPGRESLRRDGITFMNHQIASCVCSPSRSTIYTGQHIQHTGVIDNSGMPWQRDMSTDIRTVGDMMRDASYYTAYLGKWHLSGSMHETMSPYDAPVGRYHETMREYGFDDYFGVGDLIGMVRGGYNYDGFTTESAVSWMREHAHKLAEQQKPWFMAVNLVNPHDVMFANTDPAGSNTQNSNAPILGNAPPPDEALYEARWDRVPLAASRRQPYDEPGRPAAHGVFNTAHGALVGAYPFTDERIRTYQNYYFNCVRDCDSHVVRLLQALDALQLTQKTIVVMTSDHGDHVGAHQLVGKGATAYAPQNHVPLVIRHPAYPGGKRCAALTSHIDIAPTLLGLAGLDDDRVKTIAGEQAKGRNLASLLVRPEAASVAAVRDAALFNYAMLTYYDSEWMLEEFHILRLKGVPEEEIHRRFLAQQPDFRQRGAIRSVFDGRYRFSRYFSLTNFNEPRTLEALFANNDVELYDLAADPHELHNLATNPGKHRDLILTMNEKLTALLHAEVGVDSAEMMPIRDGQVQFVNRDRSA
jgi:choline-sulfatase